MKHGLLLIVMAVAAVARAGEAQLTFRVQGASMSHVEVDDELKATGFGASAGAELVRSRFRIDVAAYHVWLSPTSDAAESFKVLAGDVRLAYDLTPTVAAEVGAGRRYVNPELAAQDVSVFRVGLRAQTQLARIADMWARGAYLVAPRFNGGGSAPFAFELGLGALFGARDGNFRFRIEYGFERLDRSVSGLDAPIQLTVARAGLEWRP